MIGKAGKQPSATVRQHTEMNALVLGGTGFLGTRLVNALLKNGHRVSIAARGITRDAFGNRVHRIRADRTAPCSMAAALRETSYDVVYDNLAYGARDVSTVLDAVSCGLYVMASSAAVYTLRPGLREEDFRAETYSPSRTGHENISYAEGKRAAESVLAREYASRKTLAVRFPVIMGPEDNTRRLQFYAEHLLAERPMMIDNPDSRMSFIPVEEAARLLAFAAENQVQGVLNAASEGTVSLREMLAYIEARTGKAPVLDERGDPAPYNGIGDYSLCLDRAEKSGFRFSHVRDWMFRLLDSALSGK